MIAIFQPFTSFSSSKPNASSQEHSIRLPANPDRFSLQFGRNTKRGVPTIAPAPKEVRITSDVYAFSQVKQSIDLLLDYSTGSSYPQWKERAIRYRLALLGTWLKQLSASACDKFPAVQSPPQLSHINLDLVKTMIYIRNVLVHHPDDVSVQHIEEALRALSKLAQVSRNKSASTAEVLLPFIQRTRDPIPVSQNIKIINAEITSLQQLLRGLKCADFKRSSLLQDAMANHLVVIGEAATRLSRQRAYWADYLQPFINMRNMVTHPEQFFHGVSTEEQAQCLWNMVAGEGSFSSALKDWQKILEHRANSGKAAQRSFTCSHAPFSLASVTR